MEIPHVGLFVVRKGVAGVRFEQHLVKDTRTVLHKSLTARRVPQNLSLTKENLRRLYKPN